MDGDPSSLGNRFGSSLKDDPEQDGQEIFVRAHTRARANSPWNRRPPPKWPPYCLIFDTETTIDPAQKLNFGAYRRCKLLRDEYVCIEEGVFYRDDVAKAQLKTLERHQKRHLTPSAVD
jgi:hypothetical protein